MPPTPGILNPSHSHETPVSLRQVFWSDEVARKIEADFQALPEAPKHDQALLDFMKNDCDFAMEHADGSFMDHLQFCYEYSVAHFKNRPPRVLFLHSIMGVGTNYFPMQVEKLPKLQALLSEEEFKHIEAFPSILRLLINFDLVQEFLDAGPAKVAENFDGIKFHRVIDNKKLSLDADSFWVHLNYQLIHLMDFLPIADWQARMDDTYMDLFLVLFEFMKDAGKLQAHVDLDLGPVENPTGNSTPTTLVGFLMNRVVPSSLKRRVRKKEIVKYSTEVGHSLDYEILWKGNSNL
ncbi:Hypothetical protein SCF082_LOCUS35408 [Durusdinium trenchii]|uniref:Uncharacterized protein n=2 Tax=Durusdinium trenchii TaxID=1381693 RepID=A0ABP0P6K4_9DINO